ncbi:MAG: hypothetical protein H0X24_14585 [Ktedonobacterales bacterium]|nr:hypothetical protein [Ktedonobacterales bacterium]
MPVSRDFEATVEFDGEEFAIVLRWRESTGFAGVGGHREEHHVWVDAADLPPEVARDLKDTYTERYGDEKDGEE